MKTRYDLRKEGSGWTLLITEMEGVYSSVIRYTSRRKTLLSIVRRIELAKPPGKLSITTEWEDGS